MKALDAYDRIIKIVEPKKAKLKRAEQSVKQHMKELEGKRRALQDVSDKLQKLSDQFGQMSQRKHELEMKIEECERKMARAETLLVALSKLDGGGVGMV